MLGGLMGSRNFDSISLRYARSDGSMFSCLCGIHGDDECCSTDTEDARSVTSDNDNDKGDNASNKFQDVLSKKTKKRKLNSSSADGLTLVHGGGDVAMDEDEDEDVDYGMLSSEEKLNLILSKVSINENRFKRPETVFDSVSRQRNKLLKVETVVKSHEDRIRLLEYRSIDLEARSRRNKVIFYGLSEKREENCKAEIVRFVSEHLGLVIYESDITRAHRIGRFDHRKVRPFIAASSRIIQL